MCNQRRLQPPVAVGQHLNDTEDTPSEVDETHPLRLIEPQLFVLCPLFYAIEDQPLLSAAVCK
jgi:hypothetical protein